MSLVASMRVLTRLYLTSQSICSWRLLASSEPLLLSSDNCILSYSCGSLTDVYLMRMFRMSGLVRAVFEGLVEVAGAFQQTDHVLDTDVLAVGGELRRVHPLCRLHVGEHFVGVHQDDADALVGDLDHHRLRRHRRVERTVL